MIRPALALLALAAVAACDEPSRPAEPQARERLTWEAAIPFLAQHECDGGAHPLAGECRNPRPAREGDLSYRRVDWSGVQKTDAVLAQRGGRQVVIQTFDFGDGERAFGRFDEGRGDGADAVRVDAGGASIYMTEDGGAGVQFWQGQPCPEVAGWLLFDLPLRAEWADRTVAITMTRDANLCAPMGRSYTRWRRADLVLPWRDEAGREGRTPRATIITEHFGGASAGEADHMERFFHAELVGKVMWQRWEHRERTRNPDLDRAVAVLAGSGRCPDVIEGPPGGDPAWVLADCRLWTVFTGAGRSMDWPR